MYKILLGAIIALFLVGRGFAQETMPRNNVMDKRAGQYALINGTIYKDYQTVIKNGMVLIKDGKVEKISSSSSVPQGYTVIDLQGKYVYPSFIDLYSNYGIANLKASNGVRSSSEQIYTKTKGAYNANQAIRSEYNASEEFDINKSQAKELRGQGFGAVVSFRPDGIARGTSTLVTLAETSPHKAMLKKHATANYALDRGSSRQNYPSSLMGFISLLRQTYMDAEWYQQGQSFTDQSLDAFIDNQSLPQVFEATDRLQVFNIHDIAQEFGVSYIIKGGGDEYQRIDDIKATGASFILPLNFPEAQKVTNPYDAKNISLAFLKHWELAPYNPRMLEEKGVSFALTASGLKKPNQFLPNLRKAVESGLTKQAALKALTYTPAMLLREEKQIGSLSVGSWANLFISTTDIFSKESVILENWVQGTPYSIVEMEKANMIGEYKLNIDGTNHSVHIKMAKGKLSGTIVEGDEKKGTSVAINLDGGNLSLSFSKNKEQFMLYGIQESNGTWKGKGTNNNRNWVKWSLTYQKPLTSKATPKATKKDLPGNIIYPFVAFGTSSLPQQQNILIKNATVWTNESDGILENTDVLIKDGRIAKIGSGLSAGGAMVVDGTGKHLTSGIIDEHTHAGLRSVNDVATNSSMVRMSDVINSEDVNLYRHLAGGVVAAQQLHGSANPVGGQSSIIKFRWGQTPEGLTIKDADPFIKFALGENVKRSRSNSSIRYPQTRMGVEQVFVDAFTNAVEYEKAWNTYNNASASDKRGMMKPRRDLVHETMLEIIRKERFISCHSYVQSEINMLMKVAENFNFNINTFTHILEGYKVADKMAAHGAGASTFADWWAYKWEVRYAIPYNPSLMVREGVVTAINSDDREMARRLNQEAAKSVKYGGLSEEEALKMVTLNPAKLLHLDDEMGSIKVGKSADIVLWTDHPLSIYAKPQKTIIEGTIYFDLDEDKKRRVEIKNEKKRLLTKMSSSAKSNGASSGEKGSASSVLIDAKDLHCDDIQ